MIEAQTALLKALTAHLWDYQSLAAAVLYARQRRTGRDDLYAAAMQAYDQQAGSILSQTRAEISTLLRLATRSLYTTFLRLFEEELLPLDRCLLELMRQQQSTVEGGDGESEEPACRGARTGKFHQASWAELEHYLSQELPTQVDHAIAALADGVNLAVEEGDR